MSVEMVDALYSGISEACNMYGLKLVGGDTTSSHGLYIVVNMIGETADDDVVFRRGAHEGDVLCVTGDLGGAYAGLQVLLDQRRAMDELGDEFEPDLDAHRKVIDRQLTPSARIDFLDLLSEMSIRPSSMIDISDGLASEVHHLCTNSDTGATIRVSALPIDPLTRAVADQFMDDVDTYVFYGGEDYELLFTVSPVEGESLVARGQAAIIGEILESSAGVNAVTPEAGLIPMEPAGFDHFGDSFSENGV